MSVNAYADSKVDEQNIWKRGGLHGQIDTKHAQGEYLHASTQSRRDGTEF